MTLKPRLQTRLFFASITSNLKNKKRSKIFVHVEKNAMTKNGPLKKN
jgi:hypothetical protein